MGFFARLLGRKKKDDAGFLSIVYLLRQPRRIDDPRLRAALAGLVKRFFELDEAPQTHVTALNERGTGLAIEGQPFAIIAVDEPYTTQDPAAITPDMRKQNLLKQHTSWLACDWMMPVNSDEDRRVAYRMMGLIMAALAKAGKPEDIVAVLDKATGRLVPFDATVAERLTGDSPESVFEENVPILSSDGLEAALAQATQVAQDRLPEFLKAFESRGKGSVFAIKARFDEGEAVEWMWVKVDRVTEDGFEGRLDNDPGEITRLKAGDRVTVGPFDVADWIITDAAGMRGGFSVEVFKNHAAK